jgi:acyl-[acyl-carrier-protein]-phospholipid O-acyltransferase/long-chain-fatty-acid--[acyl-carrier-protein] ligase
MSSLKLLLSRRFGTMFAAMALGAFNDNFYKNALIIITTYTLAEQMGVEAATLLSIASAAFILPFFLCSGLAGEIADRVPKHQLVRLLKITEFFLILFAAAALTYQHSWSMLVILFLLGMQAAFFGPVKYAILPELVEKDRLLQGNALIEAGTFLSILVGTLVGGLLILRPHGTEIVSASLVAASALGLWAAWRVPATHVTKPELRINYNIFASTWKMVRHAFENPGLIFPILGISWFWAIGATYLTQLPVFTKEILGADEKVVTLFNGIFTVGIALGSFYCPLVIQWLGRRAKNLSAMALFGVFAFGIDVCFIGQHAPPPSAELLGFIDYLTASPHHIRLAADLFLLAFCGGMFIVPLYTQLQVASEEHERARTIASNNVMNAFFIATASILAALMFGLQFTVLQVLFVFALLNLPVIALLAYSAYKKRVET